MKKFNDAITKIVIEVESRDYELMGVKPVSIHPVVSLDEYGQLFVILVKRDDCRYVIWSVTVRDTTTDFYWGNYFDGTNDHDTFNKALEGFNSK